MAIVLLSVIIIPVTLGHYELSCVTVLRENHDLYVGYLITITADGSNFSYWFY